MHTLDETQQQVLELDPARHARVIGAPGSGKTALLRSSIQRLIDAGVATEELLVLAHNRVGGIALRDDIESQLQVPLTGRLVRTAASLAFAIVSHDRLIEQDRPAPELIIGARQDQFMAETIEQLVNETGDEKGHVFGDELLGSERFRNELRDLWRVLDEANSDPQVLIELAAEARNGRLASLPGVNVDVVASGWELAASLISGSLRRIQEQQPDHLTASGVLREATQLLHTSGGATDDYALPKLILVDNAQELTEGALALLAACANRGTKLWLFGDPDTATAAFKGETTRVMGSIHDELLRRGAQASAIRGQEQVVVLENVYRHSTALRSLVQDITTRIGVSGEWRHRSATSETMQETSVVFTKVQSRAEQAGVIAHRLRREHLGISEDATPVAWGEMAVVCRSSDEVRELSRLLEDMGVPTATLSGGIVVREVTLARHLIELTLVTLGEHQVTYEDGVTWLTGPLGGLDAISFRRLEQTLMLHERAQAFSEGRSARKRSELLLRYFDGDHECPDTAEGRALRRFVRMLQAAATAAVRSDITPREVLWELWSASGLASVLQQRALTGNGLEGALAHRDLDAVMAVFFAVQRHEERVSEEPIAVLLQELLTSTLPQDTLADRSRRDAVYVSTPQGVSGREFSVVAIAGPQEGVWPNLRPRGSLLLTPVVAQLLRGDEPSLHSRLHTLHDELRLFATACSRASRLLLVVARDDDEHFPSQLYHYGAKHELNDLHSTSMTLRGYVASLRRDLLRDPHNNVVARELALLAKEGVSGADPDEWYGVRTLSTTEPLAPIDTDPQAIVSVSPSSIERAEECPLNWVLGTLGGSSSRTVANIGTLMHHVLETADSPDMQQFEKIVDAQWEQLEFDAVWLDEQSRTNVSHMIEGITDYLRAGEASGHTVLANEASISIRIGQIKLSGRVDRIESRPDNTGEEALFIIDLKSGTSKPTKEELKKHAQLLAYQLGVTMGEVRDIHGEPIDLGERPVGGATLLFIARDAVLKDRTYRELEQDAMTEDMKEAFIHRLEDVATTMAAATFDAKVEHHCTGYGDQRERLCALHIIPAVSAQ